MKALDLPINSLYGVAVTTAPEYLLEMKAGPEHLNHVGLIHAAVLFAFAEICNGYLLNLSFPQFEDNTLPLVRNGKIKYSFPATEGILYAKAALTGTTKELVSEQLLTQGRTSLSIRVGVYNSEHRTLCTVVFDWFVRMKQF
jgi:acyl-coenzyme A thioesterase PaaI-like protein